MRHIGRVVAVAAVFGGVATSAACAQSLERRVSGAPGEAVQFHFAAREGVCGNGRNWLRAEDGNWYGTFNNGGSAGDKCMPGPVRVAVSRAGKDVVRIDTYAGPLASDPASGQDLGAVSARDAAAYLITLAGTLDGRPAREALLPAMLADSAVVTPALAGLARDQTRARDVRRSAIGWLARRRGEPGGLDAAAVERALDQMVRDRDESESIRKGALSTIASFDHGQGIPALVTFVGDADSWLARQAIATLARSGDPRARRFTRAAAQRTDLSDESREATLRGLGSDYASAADYQLLRDLYPTLNSDRQRDAVIATLASAGGADNTNWLLAIAKSPTETAQRRRRAIALLSKYDDPRVKDALKTMVER